MSRTSFHVAPRYTSGSPAMVSKELAFRVAEQERQAHQQYVSLATMGDAHSSEMVKKGLEGIAYSMTEVGRRICVHDLITNQCYEVPAKEWAGHYWHSRTDRAKYQTSPVVRGTLITK